MFQTNLTSTNINLLYKDIFKPILSVVAPGSTRKSEKQKQLNYVGFRFHILSSLKPEKYVMYITFLSTTYI